jgi:hypothetical protein
MTALYKIFNLRESENAFAHCYTERRHLPAIMPTEYLFLAVRCSGRLASRIGSWRLMIKLPWLNASI